MPAIASERLRRRALRLRGPRWTIRLRLTLLYGVLFLIAGTLLLAITYGLVAHGVSTSVSGAQVLVGRAAGSPPVNLDPRLAAAEKKLVSGIFYSPAAPKDGPLPTPPPGAVVKTTTERRGPNGALAEVQVFTGKVSADAQRKISAAQRQAAVRIAGDRAATLGRLLRNSGLALAIMTLASIGLGWLMAGRTLRPVRTMSLRARGISERNLHERLALEGPNDELKELGDTFDALLGRLETAFESQRRFVANASHELRTPITVERTLVEVALADPEADVASLRATCRRVLAASEQQERLIEALLTLARSQRGLAERVELDLGEIAGAVVEQSAPNGVRLESTLAAAPVSGDPALVERLMSNLIDNALHYNVESGGWVRAVTEVRDGSATLRVENSGPVIGLEDVGGLVEPFRRLDADRVGHPDGLGLGLSIVQAIAAAHGAVFTAVPRAEGGLAAEVAFPRA